MRLKAPAATTLAPPPGLFGVTALVVDDDEDICELIAMALTEAHAHVVTATSAECAIELLRTTRPSVIISDIGMPGRDGYQLIRMVRSRSAGDGGATPAIALTGHNRSQDHVRAILAGFQVYLAKPIEAAVLVSSIQRLLKRS
jgi:CheY-like chemotaxis protein